MSHRAQQILDAIEAALAASTMLGVSSSAIFQFRSLSLAENQGELPAITINHGDDNPTSETGADNLSFIDSLLDITIDAYVVGDDEKTVGVELLDKRRRITSALMADDTLGLPFVIGTRYAGAAKPDVQSTAERTAGMYSTQWRVYYRMNISDPGD